MYKKWEEIPKVKIKAKNSIVKTASYKFQRENCNLTTIFSDSDGFHSNVNIVCKEIFLKINENFQGVGIRRNYTMAFASLFFLTQ